MPLTQAQKKSTPKQSLPAYPADHKVGMKVPEGGSDCGKCEYFDAPEVKCLNRYFIRWNGAAFLPFDADTSYCCDFFEAR